MKEGWTYKKLGEVSSFQNGFAFKSSLFKKEGLPIVRISDIQDEQIKDDNLVMFKESDYNIKFDNYRIFPNDILIAMSGGTTGKLGINKTNKIFYQNQRVGVIRENDKLLNHFFLYYFLHTKSEESLKIAAGAAQPNLSTAQIKDFVIPLPPLSEQKKIVSRLDSAFAHIDALKANAKKQLDDAKALFQKALEKAMEPKEGWEEKTIGDLFKTYAGGTPLKSGKNYYEGGTIPWIRSGEVCQKYIKDCELYITEDGMRNSSAKYYSINTILVAMYGATAAQVGILKFEATSNQAVCGILPRKDFVPEFLYYWFVNIQKELASQAQGGAQPNLSQVKIKKVLLSYPSLSEQQAIVAHLDELSENVKKLQEIQEKIIKECDALKQAILREVFE